MKHNEWKTFWNDANNTAYSNNGLVTYAEGNINTIKSLLRDMLLENPKNDTIEQILTLLAKTI